MIKEVEKIRKIIIMIVLLFMVTAIPCVSAENVTIDNSMSIQDTVNSINDQDTIFLEPGTYNEYGIEIDKNITLQGLGDANDVIIDGNNKNTIILINSVSTVRFLNITFINGNSPDYGGAIHSENGIVYVDNCNFINNTAKINGGAIDIAGNEYKEKGHFRTNYGFLEAKNCSFLDNYAGHDGGALATIRGNSYIYDSIFKYNCAYRDGGALRVGVYATTKTENCIFENNTANEWGGALYNWPGELTVNNCTIENNTAGTQGGALITSGPLRVTNSKITGNKADIGGVLYIAEETPYIPSTVIFDNNYIENNTARVASLVYVDETTSEHTNFDNNYWGELVPDSEEWSSHFITKGLADMPTTWIIPDSNQDDTTPIPKKNSSNTNPIPVENTTSTDRTEDNIQKENTETISNPENNLQQETEQTINQIETKNINNPIENIANRITNSTKTSESDLGNDENSPSESSIDENKAYEVVKKDTTKQATNSPLPYVSAVLLIFAIFGYGYYRNKKNR